MEQPPDLRNAYARAYEHSVTAPAPLTQVRDPSVRSELNVLLQALNGRSDQVSQAQALLNGLAGPARQAP
ncbi:lipoprotein [Bordetella pertussis]|nr:lipoprotein [Bordetella pertussis]